ncbi:MAG: ribonuclease PH [Anaerolineales bacterium]
MRIDGRRPDQLREVTFEPSLLMHPEGSVLIKSGNTWVLCTVQVETRLPRWRQGSGKGWLTANYALLPGSTPDRTPLSRAEGGRAKEISRLVGRSLRRAVDFERLGHHTLFVDCNVLQADGGTRTAAITGGYVAVALAVQRLMEAGEVPDETLQPPIAAVSVGLVDGRLLLDLNYAEDSQARVDLNVALDAQGRFVEVQGTAEGEPVPRDLLDALLDLATAGAATLIEEQRKVLAWAGFEL